MSTLVTPYQPVCVRGGVAACSTGAGGVHRAVSARHLLPDPPTPIPLESSLQDAFDEPTCSPTRQHG